MISQKYYHTLFCFYHTPFKTALHICDVIILYIIVTVMQLVSVKIMVQCTVISQLGQDVSFQGQKKSTATWRNLVKSVAKNLSLLSQKSSTCSKADVGRLTVAANARSNRRLLDVPLRFGGLVEMGIKESGAHLRIMVGCTPTIFNFLPQSCCLGTIMLKWH